MTTYPSSDNASPDWIAECGRVLDMVRDPSLLGAIDKAIADAAGPYPAGDFVILIAHALHGADVAESLGLTRAADPAWAYVGAISVAAANALNPFDANPLLRAGAVSGSPTRLYRVTPSASDIDAGAQPRPIVAPDARGVVMLGIARTANAYFSRPAPLIAGA